MSDFFAVSPGSYFRELDLSTRVATVATSIGAAVIESEWGPADRRVLCTSVNDFLDKFCNGKPSPKYISLYTTKEALTRTNRVWVTRVTRNALHGGLIFARVPAVSDGAPSTPVWSPMIIGEPDPETTLVMSDDMVFCLYDKSPGNHDIRASLTLNRTGEGGFTINIHLGASTAPVETFAVSLDQRPDGFGRTLYIEDVVNPISNYVGAIVNPNFDGEISDALMDAEFARVRMGGGDFGDRVTSAEVMLGWELYRDPEQVDVNMLINGGFTAPEVQQRMANIAADRADCLAILDFPSDKQTNINSALEYRRNLGAVPGLGIDSSYAAIYTPDVQIYDEFNGISLWVPPSGYVAAACAFTDSSSAFWVSPAGLKRGLINNARKLRHVYNQGMRDALWEGQINTIKVQSGSTPAIWGDTTLQTRPSALQYVPVRRALCVMEKSISITMQFFTFDPNNAILRASIKSIIDQFLDPILNAGGLIDKEVVCDEFNNPPASVDEGVLNVWVFFKNTLSARRIRLTAIVTAQGSTFSETVI